MSGVRRVIHIHTDYSYLLYNTNSTTYTFNKTTGECSGRNLGSLGIWLYPHNLTPPTINYDQTLNGAQPYYFINDPIKDVTKAFVYITNDVFTRTDNNRHGVQEFKLFQYGIYLHFFDSFNTVDNIPTDVDIQIIEFN